MDKQIDLFLKKLRRRLGLQRALDTFPLFLAIGCMIAFSHVGIAYFYPFYYANTIGFFWIIFSLFLGMIYFFWHFPKETETAHIGDTVIGQERLLTALELRGNESTISCLQKEDTIYHISNCNLKTAFPYHLSIRRMAGFLFMFSLFLLFLLLPSNAKTTALGLHEVKQQAKKEIAALEEIQKEWKTKDFSKSSNLEEKSLEEKKQKLSSLFDEAKEEYRLAQSQKDLTKTKERLKAKINSISEQAKTDEEWKKALSFASSLGLSVENHSSNNSQKTSKNNSEILENKDLENNLENKDLENKNSEIESTDEQINSTKNNENTENTSANNTNSSSSNTEITSNSSNQNNASNDSNSSTKNSSDSTNGSSSQKNSENLSSKTETSSSKESLESNEPTQKNNGSGNSGKGNSKNNSSTGSGNSLKNGSGSGNGSGYNYGSKKGIEKKRDMLQEPEQITVIENSIGKDENLTGTSSKDGNSYMETGDSPLNPGVKKDFYDVIGNYTQKAYSAVENNKIPHAMTDVVKNYFSNLNS